MIDIGLDHIEHRQVMSKVTTLRKIPHSNGISKHYCYTVSVTNEVSPDGVLYTDRFQIHDIIVHVSLCESDHFVSTFMPRVDSLTSTKSFRDFEAFLGFLSLLMYSVQHL